MIKMKSFESPGDHQLLYTMPLRQVDQEEILASLGIPPNKALCQAARESDVCELIFNDDELLAVFGLAGAMPWLVCTDAAYRFKTALLRRSKHIVKRFFEWGECDTLFNFVAAKNTDSIEWLEWLGFTIHRDKPVYLCDPEVPFYLFIKSLADSERSNHVPPSFDNTDQCCGCGVAGHANLCKHLCTESRGCTTS